MPSLLPTSTIYQSTLDAETSYEFKKTYEYDFINKKFIKNTNGFINKLSVFDSWVQWCHKALLTSRYIYCIYDYNFGLDEIQLSKLDDASVELELQRTIKECLITHPLTQSVGNFSFIWTEDKLEYTFEVFSTLSNSTIISDYIELR